jgi:hypothetical protein
LSGRLSAMNKLVMQFQHAARSKRNTAAQVTSTRLQTAAVRG